MTTQPQAEVTTTEPEVTEAPAPTGPSRWDRFGPLGVVAVAVVFCLVTLRAERVVLPQANDGALHLSMIDWAEMRMDSGHLPLDGWYPNVGLGTPQFHRYQTLPHILTALVAKVSGANASTVYFWSIYLLLALWPICVYFSTRLLGWGRWTAAFAALVSPLIVSIGGHGYEWLAYTWQGWGVWTQLWGMWLLPLAWALSWRAVARRKSLALAALVVGLTVAVHFLTGFLAVLSLGVWVLLKPPEILRRLGRAAVVGVGALLISAWSFVPAFLDRKWITQPQYLQHTAASDSVGAWQAVKWLFLGKLYDSGRFPVVTILVAVGFAVCVTRFRRDERARAVIAAWALSFLLYFGRPVLGFLFDRIPGGQELLFPRFIIGVHLAGIVMAGVGLAWLGRWALELGRRNVPNARPVLAMSMLAIILVGLLLPAWGERASFASKGRVVRSQQLLFQAVDAHEIGGLLRKAERLGPGRYYAGARINWGDLFRSNVVPIYDILLGDGVPTVGVSGATRSLSADVERNFNDNDPAAYNLFNVRYIITPPTNKKLVSNAKKVAQTDTFALWQVPTEGYLQVVDTSGVITADRTNLASRVLPFMQSKDLGKAPFPTIAFAGEPAAPSTLRPGEHPNGSPGKVITEQENLEQGLVRGTVDLTRPAMVMLKASMDPRWQVLVDGKELAPQMVAPSYVGREIPAGRHTIEFSYKPFPRYDVLFAIGVLTIAVLLLVDLTRRRRSAVGEGLSSQA
jgi:Family of unknown function (DUF6541)